MEAVSITSQLDLADWEIYRRAAVQRMQDGGSLRRQWWRIAALIGAGTIAMLVLSRFNTAIEPGSLLIGLGLVVVALLINARLARKNGMPSPDGPYFRPHTYVLDAQGLHVRDPCMSASTAWSGVKDVTTGEDRAFLWVDRFQAYSIPYRHLPTAGVTPDELLARIAHWRGSAPLSTQTPPSTWVPTQDGTVAAADRAQPRSVTLAVVALSLLTLGLWLAIDWLRNQPDPTFIYYDTPSLAWYALAALGLALLVARTSEPRQDFARALMQVLWVGLLALAALALVDTLVPDGWHPLAVVAVAFALFAFAERRARALTGRAQPRAVLLGALAWIAVTWVSNWLWVDASVWYAEEPEEAARTSRDDIEPLLFAQADRVDTAVAQVRPGDTSTAEVFFIGFAGDGGQSVFASEIRLAANVVGARYGSRDRNVLLINDEDDLDSAPLATRSTLGRALDGIARRMDPQRDVLFLALSSHGSAKRGLSVENDLLPLADLTPTDLAAVLKQSHIRWRIVAISACYSGTFVDALSDPNTIVITAAAGDRTSFGCADDRDLTYFGEAFYRDSLPDAASVHEAFARARTLIAERETREGKTPSDPQGYFGEEIERKLEALEAGRGR